MFYFSRIDRITDSASGKTYYLDDCYIGDNTEGLDFWEGSVDAVLGYMFSGTARVRVIPDRLVEFLEVIESIEICDEDGLNCMDFLSLEVKDRYNVLSYIEGSYYDSLGYQTVLDLLVLANEKDAEGFMGYAKKGSIPLKFVNLTYKVNLVSYKALIKFMTLKEWC